jgi:hypothetical protein
MPIADNTYEQFHGCTGMKAPERCDTAALATMAASHESASTMLSGGLR